MSKSGKVNKRIVLDLHVVRCIKKVASENKMSFQEAIIFLLEKVLSPNSKAS